MDANHKVLIFTDLDGSLLDRDTFKFDKISKYIYDYILYINDEVIIKNKYFLLDLVLENKSIIAPLFREENSLKSNLIKGKIGRLEKIIITSRDPAAPSINYLKASGGIFKDMMIHDFDLARYYAGKDEFVSIFATGSNISNKYFNKLKDFELATAILKTKNGVQCIISNSRHCSFGYDQRVELFGSKGMIISDNIKENEISLYSNKSTNARSSFKHFFIERYDQAYKEQLNDLAKLFRSNLRPKSGFIDGKISIQIAESAIRSLKSKKFEKIKY